MGCGNHGEAVVSVKFTAHTLSGDPVEMELFSNGTIEVLSPDIEYEIAVAAMGGSPEVVKCYEDMAARPMGAFDKLRTPTSKLIAVLVEIMRDYIDRFWTSEVVEVVGTVVGYPPVLKKGIMELLGEILNVKPEDNDVKFEWLELLQQHMEKNANRLASRRIPGIGISDAIGSAMRFYDSLGTLCSVAMRHGIRKEDSAVFLDAESFSAACHRMATAAILMEVRKHGYLVMHSVEGRRQVGIAFRVLGIE